MIREKVLPVAMLVVALFIPSYAVAIQARADAYSDVAYLMLLDRAGITYGSASNAFDWAHTICQGLYDGVSRRDVVATVGAHGLVQSAAETLVAAAIDNYCPDTAPITGVAA